jgi:hypothetical protein
MRIAPIEHDRRNALRHSAIQTVVVADRAPKK